LIDVRKGIFNTVVAAGNSGKQRLVIPWAKTLQYQFNNVEAINFQEARSMHEAFHNWLFRYLSRKSIQ